MRAILEYVGVSLAVMLLWFQLIPHVVSERLGIRYRPGFGLGLLVSAAAILAATLWVGWRLTGMKAFWPPLAWHAIAFGLSYLAVHVTTKGKPNLVSISALVVVIIGAVSHAIRILCFLLLSSSAVK